MKKIYLDYTSIGGNSFQIGLMDEHNFSTIYFMTVIWSNDDNSQIIIQSSDVLDNKCYEEINILLYSMYSDQETITKKNLSNILETNGYIKNPLNY